MEPGFVFFTHDELQAMSDHLGLSVAEFQMEFRVKWDPGAERWEIEAKSGYGCPLLDPARGCRVHPVKPVQCQTFPFWDELLDDDVAWVTAKGYCPGMDAPAGRLYSREEIAAIRKEERGT